MFSILRFFAVSGVLLLASCCCPRQFIPMAKGDNTTVLRCGAKENCGQCISDERCGVCAVGNGVSCIPKGSACGGTLTVADPDGKFCAAIRHGGGA